MTEIAGQLDPARRAAILEFLLATGALKDTLRSGHTPGGRRESTAEHSWRLALLVLLLERELTAAGLDPLQLLRLVLVHDLGEAVSGDIPATDAARQAGKAAQERRDFEALCAPLPEDLRAQLLALHAEYEAAETPEARLAKGLDKIETILTHAQGANPSDFDYGFNLAYGAERTAAHPLLRALREAADAATRARMPDP